MRPDWRPVWEDVRKILLSDWNPVGAPMEEEDEYDATVGPIVSLLFKQTDVGAMADYLELQAAELYGCPMPRGFHVAVAKKLSALEAKYRHD